MKIAITGSTGLVGSALIPFLQDSGHQVIRLVRKESESTNDGTSSILWIPDQERLNAAELEGVDAVINLAGESIAGKRWPDEQKKPIVDRRVKSTKLLARTL